MTEPLVEAAKCIETAEDVLSRAYRLYEAGDQATGDVAALGLGYAMLALAYQGQVSAEGTIKLEGAMKGFRSDIKSTTAKQQETLDRLVPPPEDAL